MSDDRKGRGYTPQYSPGQYKGGGDSGRSSGDNASNKEGSTGRNSGGETGKPVPVTGRDE